VLDHMLTKNIVELLIAHRKALGCVEMKNRRRRREKIRIEPAVYGFFTTPNVQFAHFFRADIFINEFAIKASELSFECHQYSNCSRLFFDCNFGEVVWKFDRRIRS